MKASVFFLHSNHILMIFTTSIPRKYFGRVQITKYKLSIQNSKNSGLRIVELFFTSRTNRYPT